MARIRTIKPGFFLHEGLAELSPVHRLFFVGLWTLADKEGRLENRPRRIKVELFPWDDVDVAQMLVELDAAGLVQLYEAHGEGFIAIPAFLKHQRPHPKEAASTLPAPPPRTPKPTQSHLIKLPAVEGFSTIPSSPPGKESWEGVLGRSLGYPTNIADADAPRVSDQPDAASQKQPTALKGKKQKPDKPPNPRHAPMVARLDALFLEAKGRPYGWDGRDFKALSDVLEKPGATDEEIEARWVRGLRAEFRERCDTVWDLKDRWNALAGGARAPPPRAGGARFIAAQDVDKSAFSIPGPLRDF